MYKYLMEIREKPTTWREFCLVIMLERTIEMYLDETSFGMASLWMHGDTGKQRAENLKKLLQSNIAIKSYPEKVWIILWALYHTKSHQLKSIMTDQVIYSGLYCEEKHQKIKEYRKTMSYEAAHEKFIIDLIMINLPEKKRLYNSLLVQFLDVEIEYSDNVIYCIR